MTHTPFWIAGWFFAAAKLLSTIAAVTMKRTGHHDKRFYFPVYVATKVTPPVFVMCFLANAWLARF